METAAIMERLEVIFRDVLENDNITLQPTTTADDIAEWDSLNHIRLVVAIEKAFSIRFTTYEIQQWKNLGEMIASIKSK